MIIIGGKLSKTSLLFLMIIAHSSYLLRISYLMISTYRGGMYRVVIGSIWFFLMYVATDRKPDNWLDIQSAACGQLGILMKLSIVSPQ